MKAKKLPQAANTFGGPNNNAYREVFQMTTVRRGIPALFLGALLCLLLLLCLTPSAWADGSTVADLQTAINSGNASFTLTGNLTIPKDTMIRTQSTKVVVPEGKTLIMDGGILEASKLRLEGGKIEVRNDSIFRVNEEFEYSGGTVEVYKGFNLFPAADILPNNTGVITYPDGEGVTALRFAPKNDSEFADAVAAINNLADNFEANVEIQTDLTLTGMHVLTHRTFLYVFDTLTLASGSQLVYDKCGGSVSVQYPNGADKGGKIINNGALLANGVNLASGCLLRSTAITEVDSLDLGGNVEIDGGRFLVRNKLNTNGGTVKVYNSFNLFPAADILPDNTGVFSYPNGTVETNLSFKPTNDSEFAAAVASINGMAENFVGNINMQNNTELTGKHTLTHKTFLYVNAELKLASGSQLVYDNCGGSVSLQNSNPGGSGGAINNEGVMLVNSISLMPGCLLRSSNVMETSELRFGSEESAGGEAIVDGGIFRVNQKLMCSGGTITISGKCFNAFPAADVLALTNFSQVFSYASEDLKTNLLFKANNASEFAAALSTINDLTDRFIADLQINGRCDLEDENIFRHKAEIRVNADRGGSLHLAQDALLANNGNGGNVFIENHSNSQNAAVSEIYGELNTNGLSLASGCELKVGENGWVKTHDRLNIPEDAKLTITKGQMHLMDNSVATVGGTLENNGYMSLRNRIGSNPRLVIDGGTYSGDGRIDVEDTVDPDSYFSGLNLDLFTEVPGNNAAIYLPIKIDLVLPTGLTEIGAQAFANDTFASIFIPPTVTAIADDAFAGMSGLTIFGFPGTAAQNVTGDSFTFISVG